MLLVGGGRGWYLLTGTTSSTVAIPSLAPVLTPALTVPLPVSNACLKAGRGGVDARANGNVRHFKLVSHAAVFAFLFGHAQRENAAYYNEMKCNLHLNAFTKTHTHTHIPTHRYAHTHSACKRQAKSVLKARGRAGL